MSNYFNTLSLGDQLRQMAKCRFMSPSEFKNGVDVLKSKKIVIVGCGAQGLHQGLNMRDSGLDISYALRNEAIAEQRQSYKNAVSNKFQVGSYKELIPAADLVLNLTPDKQHSDVISVIMPLMKKRIYIVLFSRIQYCRRGTTNKRRFNCDYGSPKMSRI